jgi:hypothetical protein
MRLTGAVSVLVAAALALGSATGNGMVKDEPPGKAPIHFSVGYVCPDGYPIRAYGRYFYPGGYPRLPPQTVKPSRCFKDASEAEGAGFKPKPPPRGWRVFAGIYLAPGGEYLRYYCRQGAQAARFAVPCPGLTPDPRSSFAECVTPAICYSRGRFIMEGDFFGPPYYRGKSYVSCPQQQSCQTLHNAGHAFVFAANAKHVKEIECCGGRVVSTSVRVRGRPGRWLSFENGSGLNNHHVMLEWHENGVTCAVSVYGDNPTNRGLARIMATSVSFVG